MVMVNAPELSDNPQSMFPSVTRLCVAPRSITKRYSCPVENVGMEPGMTPPTPSMNTRKSSMGHAGKQADPVNERRRNEQQAGFVPGSGSGGTGFPGDDSKK